MVKAFKSFQMFPVPDGESGQSCGVLELEGSGWPRYIRTPPAGSPPPGSPSVSLGHCYVQRLCPQGQMAGGTGPRAKVDPEESRHRGGPDGGAAHAATVDERRNPRNDRFEVAAYRGRASVSGGRPFTRRS